LDKLTLEKLFELAARAVWPRPKSIEEDTLAPNGQVERVTVTDLEHVGVPSDTYIIGPKIEEMRRTIEEQRQTIAEQQQTIATLRRGLPHPEPAPAPSPLPPPAIAALARPEQWPRR